MHGTVTGTTYKFEILLIFWVSFLQEASRNRTVKTFLPVSTWTERPCKDYIHLCCLCNHRQNYQVTCHLERSSRDQEFTAIVEGSMVACSAVGTVPRINVFNFLYFLSRRFKYPWVIPTSVDNNYALLFILSFSFFWFCTPSYFFVFISTNTTSYTLSDTDVESEKFSGMKIFRFHGHRGEDYELWRYRLRAACGFKGIWGVVDTI